MFNLGAGEVLVVLLLALIVLGPQRLPDAAKQIGKFMGEVRRMSTGFQQELKTAFDEEGEAAARRRGAAATADRGQAAAGSATATTSPESGPSELPAPEQAAAPKAKRPPRSKPLRAR